MVVTHQKLHKHNNKSLQICDRSPRTAFSLPDITVVQWLINLPAHKIANNIPNDVFKWRYDVRPLLLHHPINQSVLPCTVSSRPGPMDVWRSVFAKAFTQHDTHTHTYATFYDQLQANEKQITERYIHITYHPAYGVLISGGDNIDVQHQFPPCYEHPGERSTVLCHTVLGLGSVSHCCPTNWTLRTTNDIPARGTRNRNRNTALCKKNPELLNKSKQNNLLYVLQY